MSLNQVTSTTNYIRPYWHSKWNTIGWISAAGDNFICTNISGTNLNVQNGNIDNLTATNINISNITAMNLEITNISCSNITATNVESNDIDTHTIAATNIAGADAIITDIIVTNLTANNLFAVNEVVASLTATNATIMNANITNLTATNIQTLDVEDPIISMGVGNGAVGDTLNEGITVEYKNAGASSWGSLLRYPTTQDWYLSKNSVPQPGPMSNIASLTRANLHVDTLYASTVTASDLYLINITINNITATDMWSSNGIISNITSQVSNLGTIQSGLWNGSSISGQYINLNSTNLKVTSNNVNTIQDIATNSNVTFGSVQGSSFDTSSSSTLTIGGSNANAITIGKSSIITTIPSQVTLSGSNFPVIQRNGTITDSSSSVYGEIDSNIFQPTIGNSDCIGYYGNPRFISPISDAIARCYGIKSTPKVGGSGTITNLYGVYIDDGGNSGSATVGTATSLNVVTPSIGTNKYTATFSGGSTRVGIGNTAPTSELDVTGTVKAFTQVLTPSIDTSSAGTMNIGTGNQTGINLNRSGQTIQINGTINTFGLNASSLIATDGSKNLTNTTSGISPTFTTVTASTSVDTPTLDHSGSVSIATSSATSATIGKSGNTLTLNGHVTQNFYSGTNLTGDTTLTAAQSGFQFFCSGNTNMTITLPTSAAAGIKYVITSYVGVGHTVTIAQGGMFVYGLKITAAGVVSSISQTGNLVCTGSANGGEYIILVSDPNGNWNVQPTFGFV